MLIFFEINNENGGCARSGEQVGIYFQKEVNWGPGNKKKTIKKELRLGFYSFIKLN